MKGLPLKKIGKIAILNGILWQEVSDNWRRSLAMKKSVDSAGGRELASQTGMGKPLPFQMNFFSNRQVFLFFDALQSPKTSLIFLQTTLLSDTMNRKLAM